MTGSRDILITGAASGLGRELALQAARRGHKVHLVDVSPAVAEIAKDAGGRHLVADLRSPESMGRVVDWAPDVDVLINNAGIAARAPFTEMGPDRIEEIIRVNILAPVLLSRLFLARFHKNQKGVLVNISSSAAYFPTPFLAPYGASKSFINAFSEALIAEFASSPVRIICLCPSGMNTNFQKASGVKNDHPEKLLDPQWVAARTLNLIEGQFSGIKDLGLTTRIFKLMRSFLPYPIYSRLMGYLFNRYR